MLSRKEAVDLADRLRKRGLELCKEAISFTPDHLRHLVYINLVLCGTLAGKDGESGAFVHSEEEALALEKLAIHLTSAMSKSQEEAHASGVEKHLSTRFTVVREGMSITVRRGA